MVRRRKRERLVRQWFLNVCARGSCREGRVIFCGERVIPRRREVQGRDHYRLVFSVREQRWQDIGEASDVRTETACFQTCKKRRQVSLCTSLVDNHHVRVGQQHRIGRVICERYSKRRVHGRNNRISIVSRGRLISTIELKDECCVTCRERRCNGSAVYEMCVVQVYRRLIVDKRGVRGSQAARQVQSR